jgi:dihydropteroate synthase
MPDSQVLRDSLVVKACHRTLSLESTPLIMGVINVTPDSFYDGGRYGDPGTAVEHATRLIEEGADLLDIGAESSRPGSDPIAPEEELRRLLPVVKQLGRLVSVPLSVDTTKAAVAERALDEGATLINDITALRGDPRMGALVAKTGAGVVLMHMQGSPKTMQQAPRYADVIHEVARFLADRMRAVLDTGVDPKQILLDPGIGFGKNLDHNLAILAHLDAFVKLGRPILVGVSRKAFIDQVLDRPVEDRLLGTAAAVALAVYQGARVLRVHDVGAMRDVVRMVEAIKSYQRSAKS